MKPSYENEQIKTIYQNVKLTDEEIFQHECFKQLNTDQIEDLRKTVFNLSNKILIISSIIFFYLIPFLITQTLKINIKKLDLIITSLIITTICINYFNYKIEYTGGGIFYHLSNALFGNNQLFYLLCLISLIYLLSIFLSNTDNLVIFIILILRTRFRGLQPWHFCSSIFSCCIAHSPYKVSLGLSSVSWYFCCSMLCNLAKSKLR